MGVGLSLASDSGTIRLKWHRLRRSLREPAFGATTLIEGLRRGASMELDLRVRADGGFAVLHDATLDRETTGLGAVAAHSAAELRGVASRASGGPVLLSEDLASLLSTAHPETLLQLDMKDDLDAVRPRGIDHLAEQLGNAAVPLIASGDCARLIAALGERLPRLRRGIDPTDRLALVLRRSGPAEAGAALAAEIRGRAAPDTVYLSWPLLLHCHTLGLDLVALAQAEGALVDAWTFTPRDAARGLTTKEWARLRATVELSPDQIATDEAVAVEAAWIAAASHG